MYLNDEQLERYQQCIHKTLQWARNNWHRILDEKDLQGHYKAPAFWAAVGEVCDPVEVAAHNDLVEYRRLHGRKMAYIGGVDKRAMAKGGSAIRRELARLEPVIFGGGYIPGCDHGVPSDISWPDFLDYCRLLAKMTGWA